MMHIVGDYRDLSVAERIELVTEIWESIADEEPALELSEDEHAEIQGRIAEYRANPDIGMPWPQLRDELLRRHG
ncbi:addiction module protein [bacterium]|jgi:putative addiction module component (TIGR02574 family)|nr:addiction module protein [bacterium]